MGNGNSRAARGAAVAIISLCGLLASCSTASRSGPTALKSPIDPPLSTNFDAADLQEQFQSVTDRVAPAVVAISATDIENSATSRFRRDDINGDRLASMLSAVDRTVGTGFVVDSNGYVLTNDHVVADATELWITTDDHKVYPAVVVESDPFTDLALLKIPASHLPVVRFSEAPQTRRGQWTIALGNPYGLSTRGQMCASVGIISALGQSLPRLSEKEDRLYSGLIQTTAQINPGNSGGPLLNLAGEVVGINTAVIMPLKQGNGIGFAIPVTPQLKSEVANLKAGREILYGYLGVRVSAPTPRERDAAHLDQGRGARVDTIEAASPAAGALVAGDVVMRFAGRDVESTEDFIRLVCEAPIGQLLNLTIYRGDRTQSIALTLRGRPPSSAADAREKQRYRWHGLLLAPIPANWDQGASGGAASGVLVVAVDSRNRLADQSIPPGSIITAVGETPVANISAFQHAVERWADAAPPLHVAGESEPVADSGEK
jgi:S1-C subfamily serine protease